MKKTLQILSELVSEKVIEDFAIGGAVAAIFYTEPSDTADLDIFITFPPDKLIVSLTDIYDALKIKGYTNWEKEGIIIEGLPVQFLPAESGLLRKAYETAKPQQIAGTEAKIMLFEYLCAIMLDTGRPKDKVRLANCWAAKNLNHEKFLKICKNQGLEKKWQKFYDNFIQTPI